MMNRPIEFIAAVVLISVIFIPSVSSAQSLADREAAVCQQLAARSSDIADRFTQQSDRFAEAAEKSSSNVDARITKLQDSVERLHDKYDQMYKKWRDQKLAAANGNPEAQTRIESFYNSVVEIAAVQRQEYSQARSEYLQAVDAARSDRRQAIQQRITEFQSQVSSALSSAQADCSRGIKSASSIRSELINSLRSSRLGFAEFRREQQAFSDQIKILAEDRQSKVSAARQKFEVSFRAAYNQYTPDIQQ